MVGYVYIEESFDTIFNMDYGSGKSPMDERVNISCQLRVYTGWTVNYRKSVLHLKVNMKHVLKQMHYRFAVIHETLSMKHLVLFRKIMIDFKDP